MRSETIDIKSNNGVQAINIPHQMRIDDDKVLLKKVGNVIYVIPFHSPWQSLIDSLDQFTDDFMNIREQQENQFREFFD